jgi:putative transposase
MVGWTIVIDTVVIVVVIVVATLVVAPCGYGQPQGLPRRVKIINRSYYGQPQGLPRRVKIINRFVFVAYILKQGKDLLHQNMHQYDPNKHHRRSIRLKGYDYSQSGFYFLTLCVEDRLHLFGRITDGAMQLNDAGQMVEKVWLDLMQRFTNIELHEFVVMPNHFHSILEITGDVTYIPIGHPLSQVGNTAIVPPVPDANPHLSPKTVGDIVGAFKSIATVQYIYAVKRRHWRPFNGKLFQRDYWEHIIRDERAFYRISNYIENNPKKWDNDKLK